MKEEEVPKWTEKRDGDLGEVKVVRYISDH